MVFKSYLLCVKVGIIGIFVTSKFCFTKCTATIVDINGEDDDSMEIEDCGDIESYGNQLDNNYMNFKITLFIYRCCRSTRARIPGTRLY